MNIQLTEDEINILIEAVKSWEEEPVNEGTMRGMFDSLFEVIDPGFNKLTREEKEARIDRKKRDRDDKAAALAALRHETSILLQAKLIHARNQTFHV
jgi:hypothetical protein